MSTNSLKKPFKTPKSVLNKIAKVDKRLKTPKKTTPLVSHVLNTEDLKLWVEIPSLLHKSKTDKMKEVIILMTYLGLRVSEAINFDWTKQIKGQKHWGFALLGKGNKPRRIFNVFNHDYLSAKMEMVRINKELFLANQNAYQVVRCGVYKHLQTKAQKLNWPWVPTPHDFRRSFATRLLYEKRVNPIALQDLLGHAFFATTEKYLKKDPRSLEYLLSQDGILN